MNSTLKNGTKNPETVVVSGFSEPISFSVRIVGRVGRTRHAFSPLAKIIVATSVCTGGRNCPPDSSTAMGSSPAPCEREKKKAIPIGMTFSFLCKYPNFETLRPQGSFFALGGRFFCKGGRFQAQRGSEFSQRGSRLFSALNFSFKQVQKHGQEDYYSYDPREAAGITSRLWSNSYKTTLIAIMLYIFGRYEIE